MRSSNREKPIFEDYIDKLPMFNPLTFAFTNPNLVYLHIPSPKPCGLCGMRVKIFVIMTTQYFICESCFKAQGKLLKFQRD